MSSPKTSTKKKKEVFNPFARRCVYTSCTPHPAPGAAGTTQKQPAADVAQHLGEFQGTNLTITPSLPKTEVSLTIQFSCTVNLMEGDVINIFLPGFKGAARQFALETEVHPDGLNIARCFLAYWSGDAKRKGAGKGGIPPKQVLQLCCTQDLEENTFIVFSVPQSFGLMSPDKLANNSPKIKIEGKIIRCAEGRKIAKQSFLSATEIAKKVPITDELEVYDQVINQLTSAYQLSQAHRVLTESLSHEEVSQMWEAAMVRRPYVVSMPWSIAPATLFRSYDENGAFVKRVMESAVSVVKAKDPLALHKEVAANWHVKVASVLVLEEVLAMQCASLYPGLSRTTLLAVYLFTMLPTDVMRVFAVTEMPKNSTSQELDSALRMRDDLPGADADAAAAAAVRSEEDISHSERILSKWSALLTHLLLASYAVSDDYLRDLSNPVGDGERMGASGARDGGADAGKAASAKSTRVNGRSDDDGWAAQKITAHLRPPPRLFVGLRDVASSELEYVQTLSEGDWFMFPGFVLAREEPPLSRLKTGDGVSGGTLSQAATTGGASSPRPATAGGAEEADNDDEGDSGDAALVPDNAVLFEIRSAVEGLELADLSLYPCQREWLLPFSSSYRVVSVTEYDTVNGLWHVVLEMVGSLAGTITDELIPEGDQLVTAMVVRRAAMETETLSAVLPTLSRLVFLNVRRNERRRLHPPTLLRSEYLSRYQDVQWASEAKQTQEEGLVVWQVRTHPAEMLVEEVVKPATWEPVPAKYATQAELLFLSRTRSKKIIDEGSAAASAAAGGVGGGSGGAGSAGAAAPRASTVTGGAPSKAGGKKNAHAPLVIDLNTFVIDYAGRGPRALRRVVRGVVTHAAVPPEEVAVTMGNNVTAASLTAPELEMKRVAVAAQLFSWDVKLGLVENPNKKKAASSKKSGTAKAK